MRMKKIFLDTWPGEPLLGFWTVEGGHNHPNAFETLYLYHSRWREQAGPWNFLVNFSCFLKRIRPWGGRKGIDSDVRKGPWGSWHLQYDVLACARQIGKNYPSDFLSVAGLQNSLMDEMTNLFIFSVFLSIIPLFLHFPTEYYYKSGWVGAAAARRALTG